MTRDILDNEGNKIGELTLPDGTEESYWDAALAPYSKPAKKMDEIIEERIHLYESTAPKLLREIKAANTIAGITLAESDKMFDDFQDVLLRIREGMFPTALYRLQSKTPTGFVTQEMLNTWASLIKSYL